MTVEAPPARNYAQETRETLRNQIDLAPEKYAAEAQFAPKYQALTIDMLKQATPELLKLYEEQIAPSMGRTEAASRASSRAGDIADIAKLGPQARAAIQGFAPEQTRIADILAQNATSNLLAGSRLTPEQQRMAQQQARVASSARGMAQGPNAALQEALRSQMIGAGLQQQRQQQRSQGRAQGRALLSGLQALVTKKAPSPGAFLWSLADQLPSNMTPSDSPSGSAGGRRMASTLSMARPSMSTISKRRF